MNRTPAERKAVINSSSKARSRKGRKRWPRTTPRITLATAEDIRATVDARQELTGSIGTTEQKLTTDGPGGGAEVSTARQSRTLPFTVGVAISDADVAELVTVRSEAYARHAAPGAANLRVPEKQDRGQDAILLLARSKVDRTVLGSVRVQTRLVQPLMVESAANLPQKVIDGEPVELMRGSVKNGAGGRMVSGALAKASYRLCVALGFTHILVTCREPVDSMYRAYQFDELLDGKMIDLPYSPGAKHKVLCLPLDGAEERWRSNNPSMLNFMVHTDHPDIQIDHDLVRNRLTSAVDQSVVHARA